MKDLKHAQEELGRRTEAAIKIQAAARGSEARKRCAKLEEAADFFRLSFGFTVDAESKREAKEQLLGVGVQGDRGGRGGAERHAGDGGAAGEPEGDQQLHI